jgi:hypothetical protein
VGYEHFLTDTVELVVDVGLAYDAAADIPKY